MTDREKLIDILEQAGTMRQFPGSLARILMENGVTFRPAVPGHTDQYNIAEMAYKNGQKAGYESGVLDTARMMINLLEAQFAHIATCKCGRRKMSDFYNYCPYCGEKY